MARYYLRTHQGLFLTLFRLLDIALLAGAGLASHALVVGEWPNPLGLALVLIAALLFHAIAASANLYKPWRGMKLRYDLALVFMVTFLSCAAVLLLGQIPGFSPVSLDWVAWWCATAATLVVGLRLSVRPMLRFIRRRGLNLRRIAFIGVCDHTLEFMDELKAHPEFGYKILGYFDDRQTPRIELTDDLPRLGSVADAEPVCQALDIDQVWLDYPLAAPHRVQAATEALQDWPITIRHLMQIDSVSPLCGSVTGILGTPVLDIDLTATDGFLTELAKNILDRVIAFIILLAAAPLMLMIAIGIKLTSPGPVIYKQRRMTWRNTSFDMLKFRSMPIDAEADSGPKWAQRDDERATPFGAFLRRTSLDELPQFWNVLRGEMSIVGPRPERPEFVEEFKKEIPNYMKKHRVKAGITGWAQVHGLRGSTDLQERIQYDLYYIKNWSFWLDLKIMWLTALRGFNDRNAY